MSQELVRNFGLIKASSKLFHKAWQTINSFIFRLKRCMARKSRIRKLEIEH